MLSNQEIAQSLPPVRDDEPPSLRQEIADEILDHLRCGLRRELLLNGGDETLARRRVLDRFGDPRQIARQLWYQAMWSKIVTQRLVVIMASISTIVSMALAGMVAWMIHRQTQDNALLLGQNAALLQQIAKLIPDANAPEPKRDPNFNNLKVKVTLDSKNGPPAERYHIFVSQLPKIGEVSSIQKSTHQATLGKDGIEDCGIVGPGQFKVTIQTPWGEELTQTFIVIPGHDYTAHFVAPGKVPDSAKVSFNLLGLPEEIKESNAEFGKSAFVCSFSPKGFRTVAGNTWDWYWAVEIEIPSVMFVPGHGLWVTKTRNSGAFVNEDPGTFAKRSTWEPCHLPLEFNMPEHEYSIDFSIVKLKEFVSPLDPQWKNQLLVNGGTLNSYLMPGDFFTSIGQQQEWKISVPEVIVKCVTDGLFLGAN